MYNQPKPQPATEFYDLGALDLAEMRDRQAGDPAFDASKKAKQFVGSGPAKFVDGDHLSDMSIPESENGVNFPNPVYRPYVVAPTVAMTGGTTPHALDETWLSQVGEAVALMDEMKGNGFGEDGGSTQYGTETRRCWGFQVGDSRVLAGQMLLAKNARGVGHPGHWEGIRWISDPDGPQANTSAWPMPCRDLLANEQIVEDQATIVGKTYKIQRTDLKPVPVTGTGLNQADKAELDEVLADEKENRTTLGKISHALGLDK